MRDYAEQRAVAGAIRNVLTGTATTATATGKLAEGWWMVRAYDAEVYIAEGDLSGNWSDDRAARLEFAAVCRVTDSGHDVEAFAAAVGRGIPAAALAVVVALSSLPAQADPGLTCDRIPELIVHYLQKHIRFHQLNEELRE